MVCPTCAGYVLCRSAGGTYHAPSPVSHTLGQLQCRNEMVELHCDKCRWTARRGECIPSTEEQLEAKESLARCQSCRKMKRSRSWGKVIPVILNPLKIAIHKDARRGASKEQAGNADPDVGGLGGQAGDHNSAGRGKRVDAEVKDREFLLHLSEGTKHVLGEVLVQQQELEESQAMEMVQKLDRIRLGG